MNRSLLLIVCDFLLLSFLALARFDVAAPADEFSALEDDGVPLATIQEDLADLLRGSLEAEEAERRALEEALLAARRETEEQEARLAAELQARQAQIDALRAEADATRESLRQSTDELRRREASLALQEERAQEAERRQARLLEDLERRSQDALLAQERLRAAEEALRRREASLAETEQDRRELEAARREIEQEKQVLSTRLEVADAERRLLESNLANARVEVEIERRERETMRRETEVLREQTTRLVSDVSTLAEASTELRQEFQERQARSASAIFQDYLSRRVEVTFFGSYRGVFGTREREFRSSALLVEADDRVALILHSRDTPLTPRTTPTGALALRAELRIGSARFALREIAFLRTDPRFLVLHLPRGMIEESGGQPFPRAADPFRFRELVLIDSRDTYFGEASFQVVPDRNDRIEIPRQILSRLFGEISPSPGDWLFSQGGEALGIMFDNRQAILLDDLSTVDRIPLGDRFSAENLDPILLRLGNRYR